MKVLILSTFKHNGGAAIAARRLYQSLLKQGVDVRFLSFYPEPNRPDIGGSIRNKLLFIAERLNIFFSINSRKWLYKFSSGRFGLDISNHPDVLEADVVHVHWTNFGFLSLESFAKLSAKKTVIWTLHDMWAFTGGCHYSLDCNQYKLKCENCLYLKQDSKFSQKILANKIHLWNEVPFEVVTCSNWLKKCASESAVFNNRKITVLPNAINTHVFLPIDDKHGLRKKYQIADHKVVILTGAMDLSDERKGFKLLEETLLNFCNVTQDWILLTYGAGATESSNYNVHNLGSITSEEQMAEVYNLADVFVLPSVQDNLPNTVMESMSCGVPVLAFDSGGVSDMVEHNRTGYLAENENIEDLLVGMQLFLDKNIVAKFGANARQKVLEKYSEERVANDHLKFYQTVINKRA